MADATTSPGAELPPPPPPTTSTDQIPSESATPRPPRAGQLTPSWRAMLVITWVAVFVAYLAVWKASVEIGLATWWLGARSAPQPLLVQLVPFYLIAVFGILASYNVRRLPMIGVVGAIVLAAIAVPDLSRSTGLAVVEFTIAGAVFVVSLASATGTYREAGSDSPDERSSTLGTAPAR